MDENLINMNRKYKKNDDKNIEKIIEEEKNISKELLIKKNTKIVEELNSFKQSLLRNYNDEENSDNMDSLFEYDEEYGYNFDMEKLDDDGKDIVKEMFENDPIFALNFLERRKDSMEENQFKKYKDIIINKMM